MKTFEDVWKDTGYHYGKDELESVRLGWELCLKELERLLQDERNRLYVLYSSR